MALEGDTVEDTNIKQNLTNAKASQYRKSGGDEALEGDTIERTNNKQDSTTVVASKPLQSVTIPKFVSPPIKREHKIHNEFDEKHEDIKEHKIMAQKTNTEADEAIKMKGQESLDPNFSSDAQKLQISNLHEMLMSEQNTKANEVVKMEGHESLNPNSRYEAQKSENANLDEMQISEQNAFSIKEILPISLSNVGSTDIIF